MCFSGFSLFFRVFHFFFTFPFPLIALLGEDFYTGLCCSEFHLWLSLVQIILNGGGKITCSNIYHGQREGWVWERSLVFAEREGKGWEGRIEALSEDQTLIIHI